MTQEEFEVFYTRNYQSIYRICYTYMKNSFDAEDCAEDVFVKVLKGNFVFNDFIHEKKWLTVVAINLCKDKLKSFWRRHTVSTDDQSFADIPDPNTPSGIPDETLKTVLSIPAKYKDVVYLYYYEGYHTDQIAAMLSEKPSTVRNRLRDARAILKQKLGGDFR